jgi:hypothetical protein
MEEFRIQLEEVERELEEVASAAHEIVRQIVRALPERGGNAEQAEWHVRGLAYHLRTLARLHREVVDAVAARAAAGDPSIVVMHSPAMQDMLFEFYAFIVLARILFDQLGRHLLPLFTNRELPNSITEILKGSTDCPLYRDHLAQHGDLFRYLLDLRDCLVHHRSFAASENTVAIREGFDASEFEQFACGCRKC